MSKTMRNVVIVFTLLCVVVFVVFLIELLVLNSENGDPGAQETPAQVSQPSGNPGAAAGNQTGSGAGQAGNENKPGDTGQTDESRPEPAGTRYEFPVSGDTALVMYVNDELFLVEETELEDIVGVCTFEGSGNASLTIQNVYMPQGVDAFAESFLEENYDVQNAAVGGDEEIRNSQLHGVYTDGVKDENTYEVWIYSFQGAQVEGTGLAFILVYQNDMHMYALYEILNTLDVTDN